MKRTEIIAARVDVWIDGVVCPMSKLASTTWAHKVTRQIVTVRIGACVGRPHLLGLRTVGAAAWPQVGRWVNGEYRITVWEQIDPADHDLVLSVMLDRLAYLRSDRERMQGVINLTGVSDGKALKIKETAIRDHLDRLQSYAGLHGLCVQIGDLNVGNTGQMVLC